MVSPMGAATFPRRRPPGPDRDRAGVCAPRARSWAFLHTLADAMPARLRRQRALSMFEGYNQHSSIPDYTCPGCEGRPGPDPLDDPCPICLGFREVPRSIALYVNVSLRIGRPATTAMDANRARIYRAVQTGEPESDPPPTYRVSLPDQGG
ncbi:MAG: hypothetical protein R6V05_00425 [Candidatus Brocadiia bacterium]